VTPTPDRDQASAALRAGLSADDPARRRGLSPNTVYTHIQRLKAKTGCARLAALIRRLEDARAGALAGKA
jgi:DNA-binding CsgD family transcriptional regulator